MIKTTGFEFKKFYSDKTWWPDGTYHEDEEITIDGETVPDDFDLATVDDGSMMTISKGYVTNEYVDDLGSFEGYFKKWRKKQNTEYLVVEVALDKVESVKAVIIAAGGKLKK